jgi:hypothetical protein
MNNSFCTYITIRYLSRIFMAEIFCGVHCDYLMPSVLLRAKMIEHGAMAENRSVIASWMIRFRLRRPLEGLFLHAIIRRGV